MASTIPSALARKTARTQTEKIVHGVVLTRTGLGWKAQGLHLHLVEDSPPYWAAGRADDIEDVGAARTLTRLVVWLVNDDHLTQDAIR